MTGPTKIVEGEKENKMWC